MTPVPVRDTARARPKRISRWLPAVFLLLGVLVTAVMVQQTQRFIKQEKHAEVDTRIQRMRTDLALHMHQHVDVLRTYQAVFAAHPGFSLVAFEKMARTLELDTRHPGVDAVLRAALQKLGRA